MKKEGFIRPLIGIKKLKICCLTYKFFSFMHKNKQNKRIKSQKNMNN